MRKTAHRWMVSCLASALFLGCQQAAPADQMTGSVAPVGGQAAPVAAASSAGRPAAAPGLPMPTMVACGTAMCTGFMFGGMGAMPCCAAEATGTCGTVSGGACMPNPMVAELCPKLPMVLGRQATSCCKADGTCGVDASAFGMGCTGYQGLAMLGATPPPPTNCDGTPAAGAAPTTGAAGGGAAGMTAAAAGAGAAAGSGAAAGAGAAAGSGAAAAGSSAGAAGASAAAGAGGSTTTTGAAGATGGSAGAAAP